MAASNPPADAALAAQTTAIPVVPAATAAAACAATTATSGATQPAASMLLDFDSYRPRTLGPCTVPAPQVRDARAIHWVDDNEAVLLSCNLTRQTANDAAPPTVAALERAGPRRTVFFEPSTTKVGVVNCGGLCPGLNNVVRALTLCLWWHYGVREIHGYLYGYEGLNAATSRSIRLDPTTVKDLHRIGGSILCTSRGPQKVATMVDFLEAERIDVLFAIGGDGTLKGARDLSLECERRGLRKAVIGLPKTIDNDLNLIQRSFGFATAVELAQAALSSAHNEARAHRGGIGLVKLMGRDSGFIALHASLASSDVNYCLIPEQPFRIEALLASLEQRFADERNTHALIVVSEGAGQDLFGDNNPEHTVTDASGNVRYNDIGLLLKDKITSHFKGRREVNLKLLEPTYAIRSAVANPDDAIFCTALAHMAVHSAMSGRTGVVVGQINDQFVNIPIEKVVATRKKVDIHGVDYQLMLDNSGQQLLS